MSPNFDPGRPEWKAFVHQMRTEPDGDAVRLVFADWLDDTYGECDLATFIRTQIQVYQAYGASAVLNGEGLWPTIWHFEFPGQAQFDAMYRCRHAFKRTWMMWGVLFAGLPRGMSQRWRFFRGFPRQVVCDFHHWDRWGDTICSLGPVGEVVLTTAPPMCTTFGHTIHTFTMNHRDGVSSREWKATHAASRREWDMLRDQNVGRNMDIIRCQLMEQIWPSPMVESFRMDVTSPQP